MNEMVEYLLNECGDDMKLQYKNSVTDVEELTKCFETAKEIFMKENKSRRVAQMSWESFVKDARRLKKVRLDETATPKNTVANTRASTKRHAVPTRAVAKRKTVPTRTVAKRKAVPTRTVAKRKAVPTRTAAKGKAVPTRAVAKKKVAHRRSVAISSSSSRFMRKATHMNYSQATTNFGAAFGNVQEKVTKLQRNAAGCFESVKCSECGIINTNHRCMYEVRTGGFMDGNKQICGIPFCRMCAGARGCEDGVNRCSAHM